MEPQTGQVWPGLDGEDRTSAFILCLGTIPIFPTELPCVLCTKKWGQSCKNTKTLNTKRVETELVTSKGTEENKGINKTR